MRAYSQAFQEHLDSGSTTLCYCWIVTRDDAEIFTFTDLDADLTFLGLQFEPSTGLSPSAAQSGVGLEVDNAQVDGYISSSVITEDDIANGLWDGAVIDTYWVNYRDPSMFYFIGTSTIANITRGNIDFVFETVGLGQNLQQKVGLVYQRNCQVAFGSEACGVDADNPLYRGSGVVAQIDGQTYSVTGLSGYADGWFTNGRLELADGRRLTVKSHTLTGTTSVFVVREVLNEPPSTGTSIDAIAGCQKRIKEDCHGKFGNRINHRGFSLIPGTEAVASYPVQGSASNTGLSLFT